MNDLDNVLIVTDLDGTFFGDNSTLVERNLDAVRTLKERGGYFTIATGRMHTNLMRAIPMARELFNAPIIACNGALMYDMTAMKPIFERFIPHADGLRAIEFTENNSPDVHVRISVPAGFMTSPEIIAASRRIRKDMDTCLPEGRVILPRDRWTEHDWYKIIIRGDGVRLDELRTGLESILADRFEFSKSGATFFELQAKGTTKATTLGRLREYIETRAGKHIKVYAVGDYENDAAMLAAADIGVCPDNAIASVKAVCDLCLCNNNEGVIADLMNHII